MSKHVRVLAAVLLLFSMSPFLTPFILEITFFVLSALFIFLQHRQIINILRGQWNTEHSRLYGLTQGQIVKYACAFILPFALSILISCYFPTVYKVAEEIFRSLQFPGCILVCYFIIGAQEDLNNEGNSKILAVIVGFIPIITAGRVLFSVTIFLTSGTVFLFFESLEELNGAYANYKQFTSKMPHLSFSRVTDITTSTPGGRIIILNITPPFTVFPKPVSPADNYVPARNHLGGINPNFFGAAVKIEAKIVLCQHFDWLNDHSTQRLLNYKVLPQLPVIPVFKIFGLPLAVEALVGTTIKYGGANLDTFSVNLSTLGIKISLFRPEPDPLIAGQAILLTDSKPTPYLRLTS